MAPQQRARRCTSFLGSARSTPRQHVRFSFRVAPELGSDFRSYGPISNGWRTTCLTRLLWCSWWIRGRWARRTRWMISCPGRSQTLGAAKVPLLCSRAPVSSASPPLLMDAHLDRRYWHRSRVCISRALSVLWRAWLWRILSVPMEVAQAPSSSTPGASGMRSHAVRPEREALLLLASTPCPTKSAEEKRERGNAQGSVECARSVRSRVASARPWVDSKQYS